MNLEEILFSLMKNIMSKVGNNDYYVDLLFYHRELQCLVAIDLKIDDFKPEYMGKMDFLFRGIG